MRRPLGWAAAATVLALLTVGLWLWFAPARRQPPADPPEPTGGAAEDPRLAYAGPFRNVRPDVKYVGSAACADCHAGHARTFARHPMGRSVTPLPQAPPAADKEAFAADGFEYRVRRAPDGSVFHEERKLGPDGKEVARIEEQIACALGSGTRGWSYLVEHDGFVRQ
jgi:hypothetical protein